MIALEQLKAFHGLHQNVEALRGRTFKLYQENMAVVGALRKMSSKCPSLMARSRTSYLGRGLLHSQQSKFGGCSIAPTGPRHVVLAAAHATRALSLGRVDVGLAGLHRPLRLAECCGYKIRHSDPLPSECSFQRLAPRLVAARHALAKPAMASTASSFGKTSSVKGKRYPCLYWLAPSSALV